MSVQGTEEWHQDRLGKVTASMMHNVMMAKTTAGYQNYLAQLVCERLTGQPTEMFVSDAMQHGTDTEPQARAMYTMRTGNIVTEVGFVPCPIMPDAGASPDGLVGEEGLVEIKCPKPATHMKTLLGGKIDRKYTLQMQWQMWCTGRKWCDFVSFCPSLPDELSTHVARVDADEETQRELDGATQEFLAAVKKQEDALRAMMSADAA